MSGLEFLFMAVQSVDARDAYSAVAGGVVHVRVVGG